MNYQIKHASAFKVIGQEIELTNSRSQNIMISKGFWNKFNTHLKKAHLSQFGNWIKYAFMVKRNGKLYYYCAIPSKEISHDDFIEKEIKEQDYIVVEHIGNMNLIYQTYDILYNQILPQSGFTADKSNILHFERYDSRFHWNRPNSVIEIWLPIDKV